MTGGGGTNRQRRWKASLGAEDRSGYRGPGELSSGPAGHLLGLAGWRTGRVGARRRDRRARDLRTLGPLGRPRRRLVRPAGGGPVDLGLRRTPRGVPDLGSRRRLAAERCRRLRVE